MADTRLRLSETFIHMAKRESGRCIDYACTQRSIKYQSALIINSRIFKFFNIHERHDEYMKIRQGDEITKPYRIDILGCLHVLSSMIAGNI